MKHILFADPNRDLLKCYDVLLQNRGFAVTTVFDGTQVVEKLTDGQFDLAVLDDALPRIGVSRLIPMFHERKIPVLLLVSNRADLEADAALPFPFRPNELYAAVGRLIPANE